MGWEWGIWWMLVFGKFIFGFNGGWYWICIGGLGCGGSGGCSIWWVVLVDCIGCCKWFGIGGIGGWWIDGGCGLEWIGNGGILGIWLDCGCFIWLVWVFMWILGCLIGWVGIGWEWKFCLGVDDIGIEGWFCCCFFIGICVWEIFGSFWFIWLGVEWVVWAFVCWIGCDDCCGVWGWMFGIWI